MVLIQSEHIKAAGSPGRWTAMLIGASVGSLVALNVAPAPYSFFFLAVPALLAPWSAFLFLFAPSFRNHILSALFHPDAWTVALAAGCASIVYGLVITDGSVRPLTYAELAAGLACFALAIFSRASLRTSNLKHLAAVACAGVIVLVVLLAIILGFVKYGYLLAGVRSSLIPLAPGEIYPWGTSLRQDNNFFTLPVLASMLLCIGMIANMRTIRPWVFITVVIYAALAFYVGINAASRRFVLLLAVGSAAVVALEFWHTKEHRIWRGLRTAMLVAVMVIGYPVFDAGVGEIAAQVHTLPGAMKAELDQIAPEPGYAIDEGAVSKNQDGKNPEGQNEVVISGTGRLNTIMTGELTDTRMVYWKNGLALLFEGNWVFGEGFSYQREISCRVAKKCDGFDYPHNFILSHTLFAGVFGLIGTLAILGVIAYTALRGMGSPQWSDRTLAVMLLSFAAFALVSGDTVFGLPALCGLPTLLLSHRPGRDCQEI